MRTLLSRVLGLPGHLALPVVLALAAAAGAAEPRPPAGFTPLFNGKNLEGWHGMKGDFNPYTLNAMEASKKTEQIAKWTEDAKKHWSVENGELVNPGTGPFLTTDKEYGDIELFIDYKTVPKADSGVYLRATPQVQIWDYTKEGGKWRLDADKGSGGLWNNSIGAPGKDPLVLADKPFGQWNTLHIIQVGERTTVYLNDKLVVDHARMENYWDRQHKKPLLRQAPIELQTHGGEIRWRNIYIREIPPAEANAILRKHGAKDFETVFNGKDFTGWAGQLENYEIQDGAIVCKPKKGGNVFTTAQYADFVARVEYRLPPAGNNGLALRYPGKDGKERASQLGFCEVQILDDDAPKYAKLDPRTYNGSAYGMVAAERGYLRPQGEWNFMEVTARGPTLRVELNGTRILQTDLSKLTEEDFKDKSPHPGRKLLVGHFGFCGHSDPVAFRNIEIKRLEK